MPKYDDWVGCPKMKMSCHNLIFFQAESEVKISTVHLDTLGMIHDFQLIAATLTIR